MAPLPWSGDGNPGGWAEAGRTKKSPGGPSCVCVDPAAGPPSPAAAALGAPSLNVARRAIPSLRKDRWVVCLRWVDLESHSG